MPRPRSLTHSGIAAAALAVVDREGLGAMTMRSVAAELGMGTMSLYRYVEDRGQLEGLVVDLVLGSVDLALPERMSWTGRATLLAERIRAAVGAHPAMVPLLLIHRATAANSRRWAEAMLGVLADGGFAGPRRVIAFRALLSYVIGALQSAHLGSLSGAGTVVLAALPDADYPLLADTARHAQRISPDEEFRRGLAAVLRGLADL